MYTTIIVTVYSKTIAISHADSVKAPVSIGDDPADARAKTNNLGRRQI